MRKCLRCGATMKENCKIIVEHSGEDIGLSTEKNKFYVGRIGSPKVAICPECGEVSVYIEDVTKLEN